MGGAQLDRELHPAVEILLRFSLQKWGRAQKSPVSVLLSPVSCLLSQVNRLLEKSGLN